MKNSTRVGVLQVLKNSTRVGILTVYQGIIRQEQGRAHVQPYIRHFLTETDIKREHFYDSPIAAAPTTADRFFVPIPNAGQPIGTLNNEVEKLMMSLVFLLYNR